MSFFDLLNQRAEKTLLCVGLDPRAATAAEAEAEAKRVIAATAEHAAAFKPNAAFFEQHGEAGWQALRRVIAAVPSHIPVILDAKRGDIAATADAYAKSAFADLGAHCITLSPYMGADTLAPFLGDKRKAAFVLCKTSNPASGDLQDVAVESGAQPGMVLYEHVAQLAETVWHKKHGNVGLVVGATAPAAMARVRRAAPSLWFLVPGVGAQGGDLAASLHAGLRADGRGMLINVSRAISAAKDPAFAAKTLSDQINRIRAQSRGTSNMSDANLAAAKTASSSADLLATALVTSECARFGNFTLKSGKQSPIYIDLRRLVTHPRVLRLVASEYANVLAGIQYDRLVGLPYAALPIATAVSLHCNKPMIYPRREAKTYGTKATIEGDFKAGDKVVIIDDLVTTGETKIEAIDKLHSAGLKVVAIVVLIDREMGATQFLGSRGFTFKAVTNLTTLAGQWKRLASITPEQYERTVAFIKATNPKL